MALPPLARPRRDDPAPVAFYVHQHNHALPHSAFRGQTPDEMYFGTGAAVPAELASRAAAAPFSGDEVPMPSQNRVGCDDRRDLRQHPTAQPLAEGRSPSPVVIRQPKPLLAQLPFRTRFSSRQYGMISHCFMLEPTEEGRDEELHRNHSAEFYAVAGRGFRTLRSQVSD